MPLWLEITVFLFGWTFLASAGWWLYLRVQRAEAVLREVAQKSLSDSEQ